MRFRVIGAERETGAPVDCDLEASDAAHAERIANSRGVLVRSVHAVGELAPQPEPIPAEPARPQARRVSAFVRRKEPVRRVGLRCDLDTIGAIGCGVVLGLVLFWALMLALTVLFWGVIIGAAAGAAGGTTAAATQAAPAPLTVLSRPSIPADVLRWIPTDERSMSGEKPKIYEAPLTAVGDDGVNVLARWEVEIWNQWGDPATMRIAPALVGPRGETVWAPKAGFELAVPSGKHVFREQFVVPREVWFGAAGRGYHWW